MKKKELNKKCKDLIQEIEHIESIYVAIEEAGILETIEKAQKINLGLLQQIKSSCQSRYLEAIENLEETENFAVSENNKNANQAVASNENKDDQTAQGTKGAILLQKNLENLSQEIKTISKPLKAFLLASEPDRQLLIQGIIFQQLIDKIINLINDEKIIKILDHKNPLINTDKLLNNYKATLLSFQKDWPNLYQNAVEIASKICPHANSLGYPKAIALLNAFLQNYQNFVTYTQERFILLTRIMEQFEQEKIKQLSLIALLEGFLEKQDPPSKLQSFFSYIYPEFSPETLQIDFFSRIKETIRHLKRKQYEDIFDKPSKIYEKLLLALKQCKRDTQDLTTDIVAFVLLENLTALEKQIQTGEGILKSLAGKTFSFNKEENAKLDGFEKSLTRKKELLELYHADLEVLLTQKEICYTEALPQQSTEGAEISFDEPHLEEYFLFLQKNEKKEAAFSKESQSLQNQITRHEKAKAVLTQILKKDFSVFSEYADMDLKEVSEQLQLVKLYFPSKDQATKPASTGLSSFSSSPSSNPLFFKYLYTHLEQIPEDQFGLISRFILCEQTETEGQYFDFETTKRKIYALETLLKYDLSFTLFVSKTRTEKKDFIRFLHLIRVNNLQKDLNRSTLEKALTDPQFLLSFKYLEKMALPITGNLFSLLQANTKKADILSYFIESMHDYLFSFCPPEQHLVKPLLNELLEKLSGLDLKSLSFLAVFSEKMNNAWLLLAYPSIWEHFQSYFIQTPSKASCNAALLALWYGKYLQDHLDFSIAENHFSISNLANKDQALGPISHQVQKESPIKEQNSTTTESLSNNESLDSEETRDNSFIEEKTALQRSIENLQNSPRYLALIKAQTFSTFDLEERKKHIQKIHHFVSTYPNPDKRTGLALKQFYSQSIPILLSSSVNKAREQNLIDLAHGLFKHPDMKQRVLLDVLQLITGLFLIVMPLRYLSGKSVFFFRERPKVENSLIDNIHSLN